MATLAVIKSSAVMSVKHRRKADAKDVCDTPNDQAERVMVEKMNAPFMQFNMVRADMQDVHNRGQNQWHACAMEIKKKGMTPTPPWAGKEAARRRAHGLLDRNPMASQMRLALRSTTSRNADPEKVKVKLYENTY